MAPAHAFETLFALLSVSLSSSANKELAIETSLAEIRKVWADMKIDFGPYKTIYYKIRSTEELFQALEDHSVNVSSMKSSPYYPAFSTDLDQWEKTLALISEIIDLQLGVQRQWMYLESIFMASEGERRRFVLRPPVPVYAYCPPWLQTCGRCSLPRPSSSTPSTRTTRPS